jgi:hypothetical protein
VSARYNQPGLFGLRGAEAVALNLLSNRATIDAVLTGLIDGARAAGRPLPANYAQEAWREIATRPQDSPALQLAVWARVLAAAAAPERATADELALRDDVVRHVGAFRVFMAQEALDAYKVWFDNQQYRDSVYRTTINQAIGDLGDAPPDLEEITGETILAGLATGGGLSTATALAFMNWQVVSRVFPYAFRGVARTTVTATTRKMTQLLLKVGIDAGLKTASGMSTLALSAGPQVIITMATELLALVIEHTIDQQNALPKLNASLAKARNVPLDIQRLMATPEGTMELDGHWAILMSGPAAGQVVGGVALTSAPPRDLQAFARLAQR